MTQDCRGGAQRWHEAQGHRHPWDALVREEGHRLLLLLLSAHLYKEDSPAEGGLEDPLCKADLQLWEVEVACNYHLREVAGLVRWGPWEVAEEDRRRWGTWEDRRQWGTWEMGEDHHRWGTWEVEEDRK
jgi:hypothetical protein